jgi:hypothetical protein
MTVRRFPPPWSVDEADAAASSSADPNGQPLAYVYSRRNGGLERRPVRDDARRRNLLPRSSAILPNAVKSR